MIDLEPAHWSDGGVTTTLTDEVNSRNIAPGLYLREVVRRGYRVARGIRWQTSAEDIVLPEELAYRGHYGRYDIEAVVQGEGYVGLVNLGGGTVTATVAGRSEAVVSRVLGMLHEALPAVEDDVEAKVPVTFWSLSQHGPSSRVRRIDVPDWDAIEGNYVPETHGRLAHLMGRGFRPGAGGQIMLWRGDPGTGKTYALRALAWEWRQWCDVHYITDPETFFGQHANYMLEVLLQGDDDPAGVLVDPEAAVHPLAQDGRWRLLVLEDSGELLARDAKSRTGQGLSRLLNVVDGLIGQGLRILVLVTTNEDIRNLHPAVTRSGRCAANILFAKMDRAAAREWLADRGGDGACLPSDRGTYPVADLFAMLGGHEPSREPEAAPLGFGWS